MPDLRSWLERGGFDSSDPGLTDHGRRLSTRRLVPRSTRVEWIRACTPDVSCTRGALSTEAKHLIPHRRMGLSRVRLVPRRLHFCRLPITHPRTVFNRRRLGFLGTTLRRACSREDPRAPDAFEDCVIRRILRFARHIAFRRALHRRGNRGIRRRK